MFQHIQLPHLNTRVLDWNLWSAVPQPAPSQSCLQARLGLGLLARDPPLVDVLLLGWDTRDNHPNDAQEVWEH